MLCPSYLSRHFGSGGNFKWGIAEFFLYSSLRTLDTYVLIEQTKAQVELYQRQGDLWKISRHRGLSAVFTLGSLGLAIPLAKIYQDVDLDE